MLSFAEVVQRAYFKRTSLSCDRFLSHAGNSLRPRNGQGKPFHYFAVGAAVTEVEIDGFTGMTQIMRVDILHDAGDSINAGVNLGQVEGGFVQGMGWLTAKS